ncbi:pancreatic triacylglycerol lipase-like [Zootermopsis nevadensis]|nr:pancreatic triacylglycerol lipase-like [Zootermopsis nevadensis]
MGPMGIAWYILLLPGLQIACSRNVDQSTGRLEWTLGQCILQVKEPCDDNEVRFLLYAEGADSSSEPILLRANDPRPPPGTFNPNLDTKVLIHGYAGNADFNSTAVIRRAYLNRGGSNVIVVDWGPLATYPCYFAAIFNLLQVGSCTARLLFGLATKYSLHPATVHVVGFSLGAHVAALTSKGMQAMTGTRLGRITGLDPALPLFATLNDAWKLDPSDADFVDVVHTNVGIFGKIEVSGHADFFVNGGTFQPACAGHKNAPLCSHLLAPVYFAESVASEEGFWGQACPSYWHYVLGWCPGDTARDDLDTLMGEQCSSTTRGIFFVRTSDSPPYALGKHQDSTRIKKQYCDQ